jgi:hypothetical protein
MFLSKCKRKLQLCVLIFIFLDSKREDKSFWTSCYIKNFVEIKIYVIIDVTHK